MWAVYGYQYSHQLYNVPESFRKWWFGDEYYNNEAMQINWSWFLMYTSTFKGISPHYPHLFCFLLVYVLLLYSSFKVFVSLYADCMWCNILLQFIVINAISNCAHSVCESHKTGERVMFYLSSPYTLIVHWIPRMLYGVLWLIIFLYEP